MTQLVARVVIDSPLPQLDRVFDYLVPNEMAASINRGSRVLVQFGRGRSLTEGFVVDLVDESDYSGKLSEIEKLVSEMPALTADIYKLARAVADRQVVAISDVLKLAVPTRSVAVEKRWLDSLESDASLLFDPPATSMVDESSYRETSIINPSTDERGPAWAVELVQRCTQMVLQRKSSIVLLPDFRDQAAFIKAAAGTPVEPLLVEYAGDQTKSKRYAAFLKALSSDVSIVVGSRAAVYAPVMNLGLIAIWDDGDSSHLEQSSPYSHSREVALIRQAQSNCSIFFASHVRSSEIQRLVEIGYLRDNVQAFERPACTTTDQEVRVDGHAWQAIRDGLKTGPVLIQVAGKGSSVSGFCSNCSSRATCNKCNGPIWLDRNNQVRCRWCNLINANFHCHSCGSTKLRGGRAGTIRTLEEFGRGFPGVLLVESTGDHKRASVSNLPQLVVATPGAEPRAEHGYSAVVILDAQQALAKDSLRATEDAVRNWANAIALGATGSKSVIVGLHGDLALNMSAWNMQLIAAKELSSRRELRFPPAVRLASIFAEQTVLQAVLSDLQQNPEIEILGPIPVYEREVLTGWRAFIRYEYSQGENLSKLMRSLIAVHSAGQTAFSPKSGRATRPIRVKMDDSEVI